MAGPKNRVVYVSYMGHLASSKTGSMNMTPFLGFGTYSTQTQTQLTGYNNYAMNGRICLGGKRAHGNRLAREAVGQFYNMLYTAGLSPNVDPSTLLGLIEIKNEDPESVITMDPLRYNPLTDEASIRRRLSWYGWHTSQWNRMYLGITKTRMRLNTGDSEIIPNTVFIPSSRMMRLIPNSATLEDTTNESETPQDIAKVIRMLPGMAAYEVGLSDGLVTVIDQKSSRLVNQSSI